jgi:hypothetical protein
MSIFSFIEGLIPEIKRSNIEDDIRHTRKIFDEVTIPLLTAAKDVFSLTSKHSPVYEQNAERFYTITKIRKSAFFNDVLLVARNARENLDVVETLVKETLEEESFAEAISLQKAQLLRASSSIASICDLCVKMTNHIMKAEEIFAGGESEITKEEAKSFEDYTRKLYSLMAQYGQDSKTFRKLIGNVPDAIVTPKNRHQVESMFAKDADPFVNAELNGFIAHPVRVIREVWAEFMISRYEYNKSIKKQFELRVLALKSQQAGTPNAGVEKQIQYYENQAAKLQDKIERFESKYGH